MKKKNRVMAVLLCVLLLIFGMVLPGTAAFAQSSPTRQWVSAGPDSSLDQVTSLLVMDNHLYKGTEGNGVLVWDGTSWTQAGTSWLSGYGATFLAVVSGTLYAGADDNGVWKLERGAWKQVGASSWPLESDAICLTEFGGTLYAGSYGSVWAQEDGGWTQVGESSWPFAYNDPSWPDSAHQLVSTGGTLYVQTDFSGVYALDNEGEWVPAGSGWPKIGMSDDSAICLMVTDDGTVCAGTWQSGVRMLNNGEWTQAGNSSPGNSVRQLLEVNGTLYAGNDSGIYTLDEDVWNPVNGLPFPANITYYMTSEGGTLYCGSATRVYSFEGGNWQEVGIYAGLPIDGSYRSQPVEEINETLYAGSASGVWEFNGDGWAQVGADTWPKFDGLSDRASSLLTNGGTLYAGSAHSGVYALGSGGEWTEVGNSWPTGTGGTEYGAWCLISFNGTFYAGTYDWNSSYNNGAGVLALDGDTWTSVGDNTDGRWVTDLASDGTILYASTWTGGVCSLGVGDSEWTSLDTSLNSGSYPNLVYTLEMGEDGKLYAGGYESSSYDPDANEPDESYCILWALDGSAWDEMSSWQSGGPYIIYELKKIDGTLYAGTDCGVFSVYVGDDNSTTLERRGSYNRACISFASVGGILYTGTESKGVLKYVNTYTITASAGSGGSISPSGSVYVVESDTQVFTITPDSGYNIASVTVDSANRGAASGYTFSGVTANHTIEAAFSLIPPDDDNDGDSGGRGPSPDATSDLKTSGDTTTATTEATATIDENGKAAASVTKDQLSAAVNSAVAEAKKQGDGTAAVVEIKVDAPANSSSVETGIPKEALGLVANGDTDAMKISTPIASFSFDADALDNIYDEASGDVKITAAKVDASSLTDESKQLIGDRPVFKFSVTSGNSTISEFGGNVTVSVPYTSKPGENVDAIVIYYINSEGKPEAVANCNYDPVTKTVIFTTNHFSQYAVGYNKVSFSDVKAGAWYENAVEFAAARGIVTGTGNSNFNPDGKLTRGQLLVMLMRAYGIAPDTDFSGNFSDAGNTYYTGYLAAAKRLDITEGLGNNLYAPDKQITRQEMFTLLYNTLKVIGELPKGTAKAGGSIAGYSDIDSVASWAKEASNALANAEIISGSSGKLSPKNTTSRAEMAQVLYNLLSK